MKFCVFTASDCAWVFLFIGTGSGGTSGRSGKSTGHGPTKSKTLIWAIPVALVVLILVFALVIMIYKYRTLQRSFLAFAHRGYRRTGEDDDDDDVAVTFHQGM